MFDPITWTIIGAIAGAVVVGTGIGYGIKAVTSSSSSSEEQHNDKTNIVNNNVQVLKSEEHHDEMMTVLYFFVGIVVLIMLFKGCKVFNKIMKNYYSNGNDRRSRQCATCNCTKVTKV